MKHPVVKKVLSSVDYVIYKREKFWLQSGGRYYQSGRKDAPERLLHRRIWTDRHRRKIPKGFDIHHRDADWRNNNPGNLELIDSVKHARKHMRERIACNPELNAIYLVRARDAARAWHQSAEGREWHRQQGKSAWAKRRKFTQECHHCDETFETLWPAKHCSRSCSQADSYRRYFDDERTCGGCGVLFMANRHRNTRHCSRLCSNGSVPRGFTSHRAGHIPVVG